MEWARLLSSHNVGYVTSGENVKKGEINIKCPFCGDDPSYHLGISQEKGVWACWRNRAHSGRKPHRLLMKLLGMSYEQVEIYLESMNVPDEFDQIALIIGESIHVLDNRKNENKAIEACVIPDNFYPVVDGSMQGDRCILYLKLRGFSIRIAKKYDMRYCLDDSMFLWKNRIIIPYFSFEKEAMCWTARALSKQANVRYISSTPQKHEGLRTSDFLFNEDKIYSNSKILAIVEGVFDAINIHRYGRRLCVSAVALSTISISYAQLVFLRQVLDRFEEIRIIAIAFDSGSEAQAIQVQSEIQTIAKDREVRIMQMPSGVNDPAEMTRKEVRALFEE